jgi:hypothetical protein
VRFRNLNRAEFDTNITDGKVIFTGLPKGHLIYKVISIDSDMIIYKGTETFSDTIVDCNETIEVTQIMSIEKEYTGNENCCDNTISGALFTLLVH